MNATFASPGLAWAAAAAVALPVLIHLLLRRRRRPVEWAAMDLLREAIRRVERRRRVERWLLLAVRCALVACAGFAIAEPLVGAPEAVQGRRPRTLVVVLDDSAASGERLADGTALGRSVALAREEIERLADGDRVAVLTTTSFASAGPGPASLERRASLDRLRGAVTRPVPGDLAGALSAATAVLAAPESDGTDRELLVASAFRSGSVGAMQPPVPLPAGTAVSAIGMPAAGGPNLRIDALDAERMAGAPGAPVRAVSVTVTRDRGDGPLRARLAVQGPTLSAPASRDIELAAGERSRAVRVAVSERALDASGPSRRWVSASIDGDAQPLDDARHAVLPATDRLRALVVDRRTFDPAAGIDRLPAGDWVARALAPGDPAQVEVVTVDPAALDARALAAADTVALLQPRQASPGQWEAIRSFVDRGGSLVVTPAADGTAQGWTPAFLSQFGIPWRVGLEAQEIDPSVSLAEEQPAGSMFASIAGELGQLAPSVEAFRALPVDPSPDVRAARLVLRDGRPFLLAWEMPDGGGSVAFLTVAMDVSWSTLPLKPLMVPLWQELVAEGRRRAVDGLRFTVGSRARIRIPGVTDLRPLEQDGTGAARSVPVAAGGMSSAIDTTGILEAVDASGTVRGVVACNPDLDACSVDPVPAERVQRWLAGSAGTFRWIGPGAAAADAAPDTSTGATARGNAPAGESAAAMLLAAAIALALAEAFLARRFSHAIRTTGEASP